MKHHATLFFTYSDATARAVAGALSPEAARTSEVPKTRASVERAGGEVRVHVEARDLASLRAAVNSYLRWVDAAEKAARAARGSGEDDVTA